MPESFKINAAAGLANIWALVKETSTKRVATEAADIGFVGTMVFFAPNERRRRIQRLRLLHAFCRGLGRIAFIGCGLCRSAFIGRRPFRPDLRLTDVGQKGQ